MVSDQCGYDSNGNITYTLTYDAENRLVGYAGGSITASFVYDGDGRRVKGTVNGVVTTYVGNHYEVQGTTTRKYYFAGTQRIAVNENGVLYYFLSDHLGSTAITVEEDGDFHGELRYSAWGETREEIGETPTSRRYTGQAQEELLGIYFFEARWFDPQLGRFLSPDSLVPDPYNSLDWDRYAFVRGNPITNIDPTGHAAGRSEKFLFYDPQAGHPLLDEPDKNAWGFLITSQPPLHSDNADYRNFGDNRGRPEDPLKDKGGGATRFHMSIDAGGTTGDPVFPIANGKIVMQGWSYDFGYYVVIEHDYNGTKYYSVYAHLGKGDGPNGPLDDDSSITIEKGDEVTIDTQIGCVGTTKGTDGTSPHLHFEVRTSANINLANTPPFGNMYFWGYSALQWHNSFLNLGAIYGYDDDYYNIPQ